MRYLRVVLVAAFALSAAGCLGGNDDGDTSAEGGAGDDENTPARDPVTWNVHIEGSTFVRGSITIQAGDTVHWMNHDATSHTVTSDSGEFDSQQPSDDTLGLTTENEMPFEFTFMDVGGFPYHCEFHSSMQAKITVLERFDGVPE